MTAVQLRTCTLSGSRLEEGTAMENKWFAWRRLKRDLLISVHYRNLTNLHREATADIYRSRLRLNRRDSRGCRHISTVRRRTSRHCM